MMENKHAWKPMMPAHSAFTRRFDRWLRDMPAWAVSSGSVRRWHG